ncbi:NAD-dependent epimerase/dehydratase family protein [Enteractinococcus fodinae]|uniref:Nucleoside-diphosphate-sugar epimerase n=1 Tax=Enteractinococcus fodinae TaxID=684663 RepID=A0ABU2B130_9MICC|nr:NAD-dependent epimerase/dehydratase family protein [Enteractinococcus fodinae]MDR7346074.1 nucleoside-diphosphate-sugar epimerase [Enteractinococcus fodinae]
MTNLPPSTGPLRVVLGAGPAGRATATYLQRQGARVILASRSGIGPAIEGVERAQVDATDASALTDLIEDAKAVYNCMNPASYTDWASQWPPIHQALMQAAQATDAVLVTMSNLYMYGPLERHEAITPNTPENPQDLKGTLRGQMDRETLQAHADGRLRAVVVRASDFIGPDVGANGHATRNMPALRKGRRAWVLGSADQPHSWTAINDAAKTLATVAQRPDTHGRVWFVPTSPPVTQRELAAASAEALQAPPAKVSTMPHGLMRVISRVNPMMRELMAVSYQFTGPWIIDSSTTTQTLGIEPTSWERLVYQSAHGNA